jgi:prepilin-type N-terminal cleavage/methylation domain-containing protein
MKLSSQNTVSGKTNAKGFTLMEVMIVSALAGLVFAAVVVSYKYGMTSFVAMGNYSDLDRKSRSALDVLSREIRDSSALIAYGTNPKSLTFTNVTTGKTITISYDASNRVLTFAKTGQTTQTLLTSCDQWDYSLYSKVPKFTNNTIMFFGATNGAGAIDVTACKLVNMDWKCSRSIFGTKRNTESIQTAQIVIRNKVN